MSITETEQHKTFFGKIIASIGGFIAHLFTGAKNAFNDLPKEQQDAIIQGVNISQLLKEGYKEGAGYVLAEIETKLNIPADVATQLLLTVFKDMGINVTKVQDGLDQIADKVQAGITDNNWNSLWQIGAKSAAQWLSQGKLDWVSLAMGLVEWAYLHFLKAK